MISLIAILVRPCPVGNVRWHGRGQLATSADTESEVRSEAFWVVLNAASCGSDAQVCLCPWVRRECLLLPIRGYPYTRSTGQIIFFRDVPLVKTHSKQFRRISGKW